MTIEESDPARPETGQDAGPHATHAEELARIRRDIDRIDAELVALIDRRLDLAAATLEAKRRAGLGITDGRREAEVVRTAAVRARERGIEPELVREIFWRVIELARSTVRNGRAGREGAASDGRWGRLVDPYDAPPPAAAPSEDTPAVERPARERRAEDPPAVDRPAPKRPREAAGAARRKAG